MIFQYTLDRDGNMAYPDCPNCGSRIYDGMCTWCDEDYYLEEQRRENEAAEQRRAYDRLAEEQWDDERGDWKE